MNRLELNDFIKRCVSSQGTMSTIQLPTLAKELAKQMPSVVHISSSPVSESPTVYDITDEQAEIDAIIDAAFETETPNICMHDKGVTLHFSHVEAEETTLTAYLNTFDGKYTLLLSKEGHSTLTHTTD